MTSGRIAAASATAVLLFGLTACGASSSGTVRPAATEAATGSSTASGAAAGKAAGTGAGSATGSSALTRPGARLKFGQPATVSWVPVTTQLKSGAHKGLKLRITVVSITRGTIADFQNVELKGKEKTSTPYYVTVRMTAIGRTPPPGTDEPDIMFRAIDDRDQEQGSITFFGTFDRCDDRSAPKPFVSGKSYTSCLAYLMPKGGSIAKVEWNNGPSAKDQVTPYFENPIRWGAR
jgi:hypothetical protein